MDVPEYEPELGDGEVGACREAIESGYVSAHGPHVDRFGERIADRAGTTHAVPTDSGTAALHTALAAQGIGPGDEVIVPAFTYGATGMAVRMAGAEPVIADIEAETYGIDPAAVDDLAGDRTAAVIAVHLLGRPARMDAIREVAADHDLAVIEDAAQAFGAHYHGRPVGGLADAGCFSFAWSKTITTGKGGCLVTDDDGTAERAGMIVDCGRSDRYSFDVTGYNYGLDNIRAAIGLRQLDRFDEIRSRKEELFGMYRDRLADAAVDTGHMDDQRDVSMAPYFFTVLTDEKDRLLAELEDRGIGARPFYRPLHTVPAFASSRERPVAERIADRLVGLPSHPGLGEDDLARVADAVRDITG